MAKVTLKVTIAAIVCLLAAQSSVPPAAAQTANRYLDGCRAAIDAAPGETRFAYAAGVCMGTVRTLLFEASDVCAPSAVNVVQALRVVLKFLEERPERLHEPLSALSKEALKKAFPCKD